MNLPGNKRVKLYIPTGINKKNIHYVFTIAMQTCVLLKCHMVYHKQLSLNPLRAKFFRGNINIYLHFMSFPHTDKTQVVEIHPRVRQGPAHST